jgi:hypothetical protein
MRYINDLISDVSNYSKEQKDILLYSVNRQWGTPVFKLENFVGGAQYTPFGKLRQFMLELGSRENMISEQELKIEKIKLEIELELEFKEATSSPAQKKIHDITIQEKQRVLANQKIMLSLTYEERDKFMMLITRFNESEEGKLPDGRLVMDIIGNHDEEERLEAELWATRLGAQAAYDMMFYGRVNGGNMEAIDQLPPEVRQLALENAVSRAILETGEINMLEKQASERFQLAASESAEWVEIE